MLRGAAQPFQENKAIEGGERKAVGGGRCQGSVGSPRRWLG